MGFRDVTERTEDGSAPARMDAGATALRT
jgi:hypothetical protein